MADFLKYCYGNRNDLNDSLTLKTINKNCKSNDPEYESDI